MTENQIHGSGLPRGGPPQKGNLVQPGKIGKIVRIVIGFAMAAWVIRVLTSYEIMTSMVFPISGIWIGIAFMLYYLSDLFNIGFNRRWQRWPQIGFLVVVAIGIVISFLQNGSFWGPTVGWPIFIMTIVVAGFIAISFLLATFFATPG